MYSVVICTLGITVRLAGGFLYTEGRLEVKYNGEWGSVCYYGWRSTDTNVVCRQLGFGTSGRYYSSYRFGQGTGPTWLEDVLCTGSETTLANCGHLGVNVTRNCRYRHEDVGIRCSGNLSMCSA